MFSHHTGRNIRSYQCLLHNAHRVNLWLSNLNVKCNFQAWLSDFFNYALIIFFTCIVKHESILSFVTTFTSG